MTSQKIGLMAKQPTYSMTLSTANHPTAGPDMVNVLLTIVSLQLLEG